MLFHLPRMITPSLPDIIRLINWWIYYINILIHNLWLKTIRFIYYQQKIFIEQAPIVYNILGIDTLKYTTVAGEPIDVKGKWAIDIMNDGQYTTIFFSV